MENVRRQDGTFLPGKANSPGRPAYRLPKELHGFRREVQNCIVKALNSDSTYFDKVRKNPHASILEIIIAKHVEEALGGSLPHWQELLNRSIGKCKEAPESDASPEDRAVVLDMIPREKLLELIEDKK